VLRAVARAAAIASAALVAFAAWRRGAPFARYVVEGPSKLPAYEPGQRVLVFRWAYLLTAPAAGDAVVIRDPQRAGHLLLKRISRAPDGTRPGRASVFVLGDNAPESRDSRAFGPVARNAVIGRALFHY
jgi:type IV secretory pathway protease TraF